MLAAKRNKQKTLWRQMDVGCRTRGKEAVGPYDLLRMDTGCTMIWTSWKWACTEE